MRPADSSNRARRLGRPMSSFSYKDMTLNDACPSVLGDHTDQQSTQSSVRVDGQASMKISAPRHVFCKFQNSSPTGTDSSPCFTKMQQTDRQTMRNQPSTGAPGADSVLYEDQFATGRLRVQFDNSKNEVTEYTPSSYGSPAHPLTSAWHSLPAIPSEQDSERFEGPNPTLEDCPDLSPGPPSRHASNLALRAGTFDELMGSAAQEPVALQPSLSSRFLSIRTNSGIPPSTDIQISRRASNMNDRAGTFDEILSGSAPSGSNGRVDTATAGDEMLPLIDIATSLDSYPPSGHIFSKSGTGYGVGTSHSAAEEQDLSGAISRRYTNMCNAAGAFDCLVDEDGDVLSASESEAGEDSSSHAPTISFSGMLSGLPTNTAEHSSALEAVDGVYWRSMTTHNPHVQLGMVPATLDAVGIAGVLPSDLCSEASEAEGQNPLSIDQEKSETRTPCYMADDHAHAEHSPSMLGQWFEGSLGGERSDRSLRLTEANTRSLNPSRGSSAAPPSSRRTMLQDTMPITAEHSTLSCTLSSTLSIKTPRAVLQKFSHADGEKLMSVMSTQEAAARLESMKFASKSGKPFESGFRTSDAENVPRVLPQHLEVVLPPEQEASAVEQAVLTPQEWLNKISNKFPQFPAAHMQLPGGQGKVMAIAPGGDTGTLTSRLGAFRPEEESLL